MIIQDFTIKCPDNIELAATLYKPEALKGAIMIAPATGIKKQFYTSFATYLVNNGYGVITFDNRGIGASRNGNINAINASLINWGRLDMSAVYNTLKLTFPNTKYHLVGHSAGGQLVGLMSNGSELSSIVNFASSSGSLKNMKYPFKISASFFLNVFIPINNLLFGKTNSQWVGMGEPLPKNVGKQWTKWCNGSGYVKVDFNKAIQEHSYNALTFPSLWMHATDDGIANYQNVKEMADVYLNSDVEILTFNPKELGYKDIGHMKFFSSKRKDLWKHALTFLDKHSS